MPTSGKLDVNYQNYGFHIPQRKATPGYYSSELDKYGIRCEVTSAMRSSVERFTFRKGEGNILLNIGDGLTNEVGGMLKRVSHNEIEGIRLLGTFCYNPQAVFPMYFVMRINKKATEQGYWKKQPTMAGVEGQWDPDNGKYKLYRHYGKEMAGNEIGILYHFNARRANRWRCRWASRSCRWPTRVKISTRNSRQWFRQSETGGTAELGTDAGQNHGGRRHRRPETDILYRPVPHADTPQHPAGRERGISEDGKRRYGENGHQQIRCSRSGTRTATCTSCSPCSTPTNRPTWCAP